MKKPLPPSITGLLNGTTKAPAPVVPTIAIEIPTGPVSARAAWYQQRHDERLARANRRFIDNGGDCDLPF